MAIVKVSGLITDINGSINGSTFQNSLGGLSIKSKSFKTKSFSVGANDINNIIQLLSNHWRNLTQADRDVWNSYALFAPVVQNNGSGRFINGQQYFMKYAAWFYSQFLTIPALPAFTTSVIANPAIAVRCDGADLYVDSNVQIDETVSFLLFKISASMPQSRKSPVGGTKQIICSFVNAFQCTITNQYLALYGRLPQNPEYVFIEYKLVSSTNPLWANPFREKREVDV